VNTRLKAAVAVLSTLGVGAVAAIAVAGASSAFAETPTPTPTVSDAAPADLQTPSASPSTTPSDDTDKGQRSGSKGKVVTGADADKATAAVLAKDPAVSVTSVRQDSDGSYDVLGTKAGAKVKYEVSADFATVTLSDKSGYDGSKGKGTVVTGADADKATAAVLAKDSAVTVTSVRQDSDGSYDVLGTKAGAKVKYEVSADFATVTLSDKTGR